MQLEISPKYKFHLIDQIEHTLLSDFGTPKKMELYLKEWQKPYYDDFGNQIGNNFEIQYTEVPADPFGSNSDTIFVIDIFSTLSCVPEDLLIKIAIDLGVDTPGFIPSIPQFKNVLKGQNKTALGDFENACKSVYKDPDLSVLLASSTLDSIVKTVLEKYKITVTKNSLFERVKKLLEQYKIVQNEKVPKDICKIATQLCAITESINNLRNEKTSAGHGKTDNDYVIDNPLWAILAINSCATIGLFFWQFYQATTTNKETNESCN
jgi:hypothetical protein